MSRIFLFFTALMPFLQASCQDFSLLIGSNLSNLHSIEKGNIDNILILDQYEPKIGYNVGIVSELKSSNKKISIEFATIYVTRGAKYDIRDLVGSDPAVVINEPIESIKFTYLMIPITLKKRIYNFLTMDIGTATNYLLSYENKLFYNRSYSDHSFKDKIDFGLIGGITCYIEKLQLTLNYYHGLLAVEYSKFDHPDIGYSSEKNKIRGLNFQVAYKLFSF